MVEAFNTLSDARGFTSVGMGGLFALPIAFSEIDIYMSRFGIVKNGEVLEFIRVIQALDPIMREHLNKKYNPPSKSSTKK